MSNNSFEADMYRMNLVSERDRLKKENAEQAAEIKKLNQLIETFRTPLQKMEEKLDVLIKHEKDKASEKAKIY